jgi:acyl-CoA thioesterase-2
MALGSPSMDAIEVELSSIVALEQRGRDVFRGTTVDLSRKRVFGGQVVAQALAAAIATVDPERAAHSLHGYFLRPGNPKTPIDYSVDRFRDGKSFTTRGVIARQGEEIIFTMSCSFQRRESGFEHHRPMPLVPRPETLPDQERLLRDFAERMPSSLRDFLHRRWPIELRPIDPEGFVDPTVNRPSARDVWFRAARPLPAEAKSHLCTLAYASDLTLIDSALIPHGRSMFDSSMMMASLDHAMWFHEPFRADEWLLYAQESPSASGSRGFNRGLVYTASGVLAASVAQEGLMRPRRAI